MHPLRFDKVRVVHPRRAAEAPLDTLTGVVHMCQAQIHQPFSSNLPDILGNLSLNNRSVLSEAGQTGESGLG